MDVHRPEIPVIQLHSEVKIRRPCSEIQFLSHFLRCTLLSHCPVIFYRAAGSNYTVCSPAECVLWSPQANWKCLPVSLCSFWLEMLIIKIIREFCSLSFHIFYTHTDKNTLTDRHTHTLVSVVAVQEQLTQSALIVRTRLIYPHLG